MMAHWLVSAWERGWLLGQGGYLAPAGGVRRGNPSLDEKGLLLLAGGLVCAMFIIWVINRHFSKPSRKAYHHARRLFRELCRAHKLGWRDRRLLLQLARAHRLPHAAQLFVDPQRFVTLPHGEALACRQATLAALHTRLFEVTATQENGRREHSEG